MTEGKFFGTTDIIGILVCFAVLVGLGFLFQSNAIDTNTVMVGFMLLLLFAVGRNAIPAIMLGAWKNQVEGKGLEDHWQQARKEINDTPTKYNFSYNYRIPEEYYPYNAIELEEAGLVLFEINRDDLTAYSGEEEDSILFPYPIMTIIVKTANGKIKAALRGKSLDQTVEFIKENMEFWKPSTKRLILPEEITTTRYGQPIETTRPTEAKAK